MKTKTRVTLQQRKDRSAVSVGACHNLGAGGVDMTGTSCINAMSVKRFDQFIIRTNRALGWRE